MELVADLPILAIDVEDTRARGPERRHRWARETRVLDKAAVDRYAPHVRPGELSERRLRPPHRQLLFPASPRIAVMDSWSLAIIAALVLGYAGLSRRLERTVITAPMLFVAVGLLVGTEVLGWLVLSPAGLPR